jgi:hypothetical protein
MYVKKIYAFIKAMGLSIGYGSTKFIAIDALISNLRARGYVCERGSDHNEHYIYIDGYGTYQIIFTNRHENVIKATLSRVSRNKIEDYFQTEIDLMF